MNKLLPLLIVLAFAGCKKDNNTTDLLTRSWQITAVTTKTNDGVSTPWNISSCDENKIWTFKNDGNFSMEPLSNCISNGFVDVFNGRWILTDDKILTIDAQGGNGAIYFEAEIVKLTKSKLIIRVWLTLDGRAVFPGNSGGFGRAGFQQITEFSPR